MKSAESCLFAYPPPENATDREVVERGDRIGLRPHADRPGSKPTIAMIQQERPVEIALYMITDRDDPESVPFAEGWGAHPSTGKLVAAVIVVVESEIAFEGVRSNEFIGTVGEPEHDVARGILGPRDALNRTETSTSVYGPPGATITLKVLSTAR
jgi:hypothetical protein